MTIDLSALMVVAAASGSLFWVIVRAARRERELKRFSSSAAVWWDFVLSDVRRLLAQRAQRRGSSTFRDSDIREERLLDAGLSQKSQQERFYLLYDLALVATLVMVVLGLSYYEWLTASILVVAFVLAGYWGPRLVLWMWAVQRIRRIERELPFILQLSSLGTSIGWAPVRVLDRLTEGLQSRSPSHPLIQEFVRARWCANTGGSWSQGIELAIARLPDASARRSLTSLCRVLDAEGPKHELISAIAGEAHRDYILRLDHRASGLTLKVVLLFAVFGTGLVLMVLAPVVL